MYLFEALDTNVEDCDDDSLSNTWSTCWPIVRIFSSSLSRVIVDVSNVIIQWTCSRLRDLFKASAKSIVSTVRHALRSPWAFLFIRCHTFKHVSSSRCFAYISVRNSWTGWAPFFLYFVITASIIFVPIYRSVGEISENEIQSTSRSVQLRTTIIISVWWSRSISMVSSLFPFAFFVLDLFLLDEPESKVVTPPVIMYDGRADYAHAALTVDTTARTHVSNDPFLIDWTSVTDFSLSILSQAIKSRNEMKWHLLQHPLKTHNA